MTWRVIHANAARMMFLYEQRGGKITRETWQQGLEIHPETVWLDLLNPTMAEESAAEVLLGIGIPTREEMHEIELSSRLYQENGALFMTAMLLSKVDTGVPEAHAVTFIVTATRLVTVRYIDTTSFQRFGVQMLRQQGAPNAAAMLLMLLDAITDRIADILERLGADIDALGKEIFRVGVQGGSAIGADYQRMLGRIGRCGDLSSKIHESLVTLGRVASYAANHRQMMQECNEAELLSLRKDIDGLSDHGNYLTSKVNFLLDATLGMVSIEQNSVFRVLSVASLIFMPPTLIAGIYGMNFKLMPELEWHYGYPLSLLAMLVSAVLPLAYLRQKRML